MGIGNKEKNFRKYLENHFGIALPADVAIFYAKGVRIGNKEIAKSGITGELGYAACDFGFNPTNALIQNFGHLATRNTKELDEKQAKEFAAGQNIACDLGSSAKQVILKYKEHVLGLGYYAPGSKRILNKVPEKRRRKIVNNI